MRRGRGCACTHRKGDMGIHTHGYTHMGIHTHTHRKGGMGIHTHTDPGSSPTPAMGLVRTIYIYVVYTVFLAGKSPNIWSYT